MTRLAFFDISHDADFSRMRASINNLQVHPPDYGDSKQVATSLRRSSLIESNPMPPTREQILENRRRLRAEYGELFDSTAALLFRHDPKYEPEAETILPRLRVCHSSDDVLRVVHEEFVRWFDSDTAGSPERYQRIASEIWQLWQSHQGSPKAMPPEL